MEDDCYLIIGNHNTLVGNWEQVEITLKTFQNAGYPIRLSQNIVLNKINIIIESFNRYLVKEMLEVSKSNPQTKFILYVTEYLTQRHNQLHLNVFSRRDFIFRKIAAIEAFCFRSISELIDLSDCSRFQYILEKFRRKIVRPLLYRFFSKYNKSIDNEIMMAIRERNLFKIAHLFSLCISTTEAVLRGYNKLCSCKLSYLPVFIDVKKTLSNRKRNKKLPTIFFSGRITPYRRSIISQINSPQINKEAYPLSLVNLYPKNIKDDFNDKLNKLTTGLFGDNIAEDSSKIMKQINNIIEIKDIPIYELLKQKAISAFEIYVPQDINWPYSSPNRTLLSIESGFVPMDYGKFDDHDINEVSISIDNKNIKNYIYLTSDKLKEIYKSLDTRIRKYNRLQEKKLIAFKELYLQEIYNCSNISEVSKEKSSGKSITTG